jgi:hypothetical protein
MLRCAAVLVGAAAVAAGWASATTPTATVACTATRFTVVFDPARGVTVRSGSAALATVTYASAKLSPACRAVAPPKGFLDNALGLEARQRVTLDCKARAPIRLHVNRIREAGLVSGTSITIGTGDPLQAVVSAVVKHPAAKASRLYRATRGCKQL